MKELHGFNGIMTTVATNGAGTPALFFCDLRDEISNLAYFKYRPNTQHILHNTILSVALETRRQYQRTHRPTHKTTLFLSTRNLTLCRSHR